MPLTRTVQKNKSELDKKRWLVRYSLVAAVGTALAIKLYLVLFVIDILVGLYSIITTSVLFTVLFISYVKFRDPYNKILSGIMGEGPQKHSAQKSKLMASIIIPVKNEEGNIRNCVESALNSTYPHKEVIVVNDGSNDKTGMILDEIHREWENSGNVLKVIHLSKNIGKKKAIEAAIEVSSGDIFVFTDSDCNIDEDAVEKTIELFEADREVGAVTAHGRVRNADNGNALEKIQHVWYDGQYRIIKGMESSFASLTCCSGAYSAFRSVAVRPYIHRWANDMFLGKDFKFCTDRLLTSYVLRSPVEMPEETMKDVAASKQNSSSVWSDPAKITRANDSSDTISSNDSIYATGKDNLDVMKSGQSLDEDDMEKSNKYTHLWKVIYSPSVKVTIGPPTTFRQLIKQQIRWRKSFIRSIFATGGIYWKRPAGAAFLYYLQLGLKIIRPYIVFHALLLLPLLGDYLSGALYLSSVLFSGMIYGIDYRLRHPGDGKWLYRPLMTMMSTFVFSWLIIYAAMTIRKMSWR
jgi:hyaluronan synthase